MEDTTIATHARQGLRLLDEWESNATQPNSLTNLVSLQILVMTIIALDQQFTPSPRARCDTVSKAQVLGRAVMIGYSMKLFNRTAELQTDGENEMDSIHNVGLRTWWVLVVLDNWHAFSMAVPPLILETFSVPMAVLKPYLGDVPFYFMRELPQRARPTASFLSLANSTRKQRSLASCPRLCIPCSVQPLAAHPRRRP